MKRIKVQGLDDAKSTVPKSPELLRLEPFGVTAGVDSMRPLMLFRVEGTDQVMPVWLSAIEAGIAVAQHHQQGTAQSPHDISLKLLTELGLRVEACIFDEVRGHHQYVRVVFATPSGRGRKRELTVRAEQAVSFCLQGGAEFFARPQCLQASQLVNTEMAELSARVRADGKVYKNKQRYLN